VVLVALVAAAAIVGYERSAKAGPYGQFGGGHFGVWLPRVSSVLPLYENCGTSTQFEPRVVETCSSPCGSVLAQITWTTWTVTEAIGIGTFSSNLHQRDCSGADGVPRPGQPHPGVRIVLRAPQTLAYCAHDDRNVWVLARGVLFTTASLLGSLHLERPHCASTFGE
jgi:hypothetical protein